MLFRSLLAVLAASTLLTAPAPVLAAKANVSAYELADSQLTTLQKQLTSRLKPAVRKRVAIVHDAWLEFRAVDGDYYGYGQRNTSAALLKRATELADMRNRQLTWLLKSPTTQGEVISTGAEIKRYDAVSKYEKAVFKEVRRHLDAHRGNLLATAEAAWDKYRTEATAPEMMEFQSPIPNVSRMAYMIRLTEDRIRDLQTELKRLKAMPG